MRVLCGNLVSITLAALLCMGAAKHTSVAAAGLSHSNAAFRLTRYGNGERAGAPVWDAAGQEPRQESSQSVEDRDALVSDEPLGSPPVSYLISTYAGGLPTATAATATGYPLLTVNAVVVDPAGNVFLSSALSCVFKLDPAGNLTRVAGDAKTRS